MATTVEAKVADPDRANGLLGALESHIHRPTDIVIRTGTSHIRHLRLEDLNMLQSFQKIILHCRAAMKCFEGIVEPDIVRVEASDLVTHRGIRDIFVEIFKAQNRVSLLIGR